MISADSLNQYSVPLDFNNIMQYLNKIIFKTLIHKIVYYLFLFI